MCICVSACVFMCVYIPYLLRFAGAEVIRGLKGVELLKPTAV